MHQASEDTYPFAASWAKTEKIVVQPPISPLSLRVMATILERGTL